MVGAEINQLSEQNRVNQRETHVQRQQGIKPMPTKK